MQWFRYCSPAAAIVTSPCDGNILHLKQQQSINQSINQGPCIMVIFLSITLMHVSISSKISNNGCLCASYETILLLWSDKRIWSWQINIANRQGGFILITSVIGLFWFFTRQKHTLKTWKLKKNCHMNSKHKFHKTKFVYIFIQLTLAPVYFRCLGLVESGIL